MYARTTMSAPSSADREPESSASLRTLHEALGVLMRSEAVARGHLDGALALVTELATRVVAVRRASVWRLASDRSSIECADLFDAEAAKHSRGVVLTARDTPSYFAAIGDARCIAADDARTDPRTHEFTDGYLVPLGITSMLDAPILLRGELVGVLCLEHVGRARHWRGWEELVAGTLADFVAMALAAGEHASQRSELSAYGDKLELLVEERTRELRRAEQNVRALFDLAPVALVVTSIADEALLDANERAATMFDVTRDELGTLELASIWVNPTDRLRLLDAVKRSGRVERFEAELRTRSGLSFWAELSAGSFSFGGTPALLVGFHDVTEQRLAEERLRRLATLDGLTGLYNRRHFFELAEAEIERSKRHGHATSVAMLDVDHFKAVNDELGHAAGDVVLVALASRVRERVRKEDVVARYGGEEFVVLFPETRLEDARTTLERIRAAVMSAPIETSVGSRTVTVSIGLAERREGEPLGDVLRRADVALYAAKESGRNRLEIAR